MHAISRVRNTLTGSNYFAEMRGNGTLQLSGSGCALLVICVKMCLHVASCGELANNDNGIEAMPLISEDTNSTSVPVTADATPQWRRIMNNGQLVLTVTGVVANIMTFVTLTVNGGSFCPLTCLLLKHQALIDASVCAFATGVFIHTSVRHVSVYAIDFTICFIWHTQLPYWISVLLSVWNLVLIAFDRLLAVCYPDKYSEPSPLHLKIVMPVMYACAFCSLIPAFFLVHFVNGHCILEISLPLDVHIKLYWWYSIYWLFVVSVIPITMLVVLYGRIIKQLRRHIKAVAAVAQTTAITKSTIRVTKCALTVTAIFVATISYHSIYFFISNVGIINFDFAGPVQLLGMLLVVGNSFANPFIYAIYMPSFRRSVLLTFCRRKVGQEGSTTT